MNSVFRTCCSSNQVFISPKVSNIVLGLLCLNVEGVGPAVIGYRRASPQGLPLTGRLQGPPGVPFQPRGLARHRDRKKNDVTRSCREGDVGKMMLHGDRGSV